MQDIIYDVAISADGFIAGIGDDVSAFPHEGPHVADYLNRLQTYGTAIMGRCTYEFGYRFGMAPGQNPYPHMRTIVVSDGIELPPDAAVERLAASDATAIQALRQSATAPIYLCGGGVFAGWMLRERLISQLRLKRAPVLLGDGTRLFGADRGPVGLRCTATTCYENNVIYQAFDLT